MAPARVARLTFQLPRSSRLFTKVQPANQWGWKEVLLNKMAYSLEVLVWAKSKDAQKKLPQKAPKPFIPDFFKNLEATTAINKDIEPHTVEEIKAMLAKPRK